MSGLVVPKIECVESSGNFGRFLAEPLEKGFGISLGNVLRRVLLGYLPGAAVTRVRIEGIHHEFSTIPHVKEDSLEFLLNVKGIRLRPISGRPATLTLEAEGEGQLCAADIKPSTDFEIVNPELYLATLDSPEARLYVEFEVELGEGYIQAGSSDNLPVGTIPIDAIFTPMRKVNFTIEPIHIGQETSRERLRLEVWTDGTISPTDAIGQGANILVEQLSPFVDHPRMSQMKVEEEDVPAGIADERYSIPVEQLDLSVRTMNCLRRAGITTVGELLAKEEKEMMALRNFGQKSKEELDERLAVLGLSSSGESKEEAAQPEEAVDLVGEETSIIEGGSSVASEAEVNDSQPTA
ncbi:DNA-directed RNA polymerase subunit alpha [Chloroflexota bacterium]